MNPGARAGRGRRLWARWQEGLRAAGVAFACALTERPGDAAALACAAADADTVVAVGGDGTINGVLDGVVRSGRADLRMGVLYAGTSPDFCRFHGIPVEPERALAALLAGRVRRVDVARIACRDARGESLDAHFGCGCNVGLGAVVARFANGARPFLGDGLGTGLGVVRAILRMRPADLELEIDGEPCRLAGVNNLSVLKSPHIASGLRLDVELRPDDGRLCLVAVQGRSRAGLCRLLPGFYSGAAARADGVLVRSCARVRIRSRAAGEVEFDGDPRGALPAAIEVLPGALALIGGTP